MAATYEDIFENLWPWFVKWGANGKLLTAARLFSGFLGTSGEDDDEDEDDSRDIDDVVADLGGITGNADFAPLRATHQVAYVELLVAFQNAGFDFDPNHAVSLQQNKNNNPAIDGFFVAEFLALCRDLRVFGPQLTFKPAKTIKNVMRIMKVAKNRG